VDLPFFAEELEPIILERLHLASERTDVAGRIQGHWSYGFPEPRGFARSRRVEIAVTPPATKPEATELDLYGFDAQGTLHGCFVLCRGCESEATLLVPLAAPPSPGRLGRAVLYGARHPDHAGLAFLGLLAAVACLLIASRKRPKR
jgi:hypothetical protein